MNGRIVLPAAFAMVLAAGGPLIHHAHAAQPASCAATSALQTSPVDSLVQLGEHKTPTGPEPPATPMHPPKATTPAGTEKPFTPLPGTTTPRGTVELKDHTGKVCQPFDVFLGTEAGTSLGTISSCYVSPASVATCTLPAGGSGPVKVHCLKKGDAKVAAEAVEFFTGRVVTLGFVLHCR